MLLKKLGDNLKNIFALLIAGLTLIGCSSSKEVYYEVPIELKNPEAKINFYNQYSKCIYGKKFFLDPGHGGTDRNNKGYKGIAVEADLNLRVALALRDYLQEAGAIVFLSRTSDSPVALKERSVMANNSGADVFISIHHNAPGKSDDYFTDYTSTYYHALDTNYEYEPCNHDLAKYIQRDIAYAMRNSGGPGSFDGTYSDYWIYPGMGFSVLRLTKLPAVLVECGFNTQHFEAQRLVLEEFNKIEAWGIFRGICRYFSAGVPTISSLTADSVFNSDSLNLSFQIKDSNGIDQTSIKVEFDSVIVSDNSFDPSTGILNFNRTMLGQDPGYITEGEHVIRIIVSNKKGNHSFPFYKKFKVVKNI